MSFEDLIREYQQRREKALAMGGAEKLAKRKAQGHLDARERLDYLLDPGSMQEMGLFATSSRPELREKTPADAKVTVFGKINQRSVAVVSNDLTVLGASSAVTNGKKIKFLKHVSSRRGLPIGVKDVIDASGMPTACNSPIYSGHHPIADAACVAMARRAGAIIIGKTVTTEFAFRMPGPTRNPHKLSHSPGGSSSGSAAAVADAMAPLAFGTQTAGSTIRPGAYCGIVAYKPSYGTINCAGLKHLAESLDTIGVFGRTVEDCALLAHVTSSRRLPTFKAPPPHALRIGLCRTSHWSEADPSTQLLLDKLASTLSNRGAVVTELVLPNDFAQLYDDQILIMKFEAARALACPRSFRRHSNDCPS